MPIQGMLAKLKYKVGGFGSVNPWLEMSNVKDVTLTVEAGEAEMSTRENLGWRATLATLKEGTLEFEMNWEPGNAGFQAIKDAMLNSTIIGLAALDQEGATGEGLVADFAITNFSRSEPLEEVQTVSVTAKLSKFSEWTTTGVS